MTRLRALLLAVTFAVAMPAAVPAADTAVPASTGAGCEVVDGTSGRCLIRAVGPGIPAPSDGDGQPVNSGGREACYFEGEEIPCALDGGVWDGTCYLKLADPQPPKSDRAWEGRTDGAIYECRYLGYVTGIPTLLRWLPTPPAAAVVDPAVLADQAVAAMGLRAIEIGMAPGHGPDSLGYVGLPVYLWVQSPSAQTFGPVTESVSAGGVTTTATAQVEKVEWSMGDGTVVTCTGPGTPYSPGFGDAPSPDCGHEYTQTSADQPGQAYLVQATSYWVVDWDGGGQTGTITLELTAETSVRIGEIQVLITR